LECLVCNGRVASFRERRCQQQSNFVKKTETFRGVHWIIPFNKPCVFPEGLEAIQRACDIGKLSGDGHNSKQCVQWFGKAFGYTRSLLTPSCTAALEMAALLLELKGGDEVICPSFTFVSSANAFALRGVTMVFADSESGTPNVCVDDVLSKITDSTKAIVVVHYAGIPIDLSRLVATGIPIVEDCAHAIGSIDPFTGKVIGLQGCVSTFSFHETKNISVGEGGMIVVNDPVLWEKAQIIREKGTNRTQFAQGKSQFYTWLSLGSSYLLSDVDAGLLWGALQRYKEIQASRAAIWDAYDSSIVPSDLYQKPKQRANAHMYYLRFATHEQRIEFSAWMKDAGILVATHYLPLDTSPFSQAQGTVHEPCSQALAWSQTLVRLPLFYSLTKDELHKVISTVNGFAMSKGLVYDHASTGHYEDILRIRNAHRSCFGNTEEIDFVTHKQFMGKHAVTYRVALKSCRVVGFIGHVQNDLRLAVDESLQGHGVAQFLWSVFVKEFPDVTVQVKRDNERSLRFFKSLGWHPDPSAGDHDPVPLLFERT
jgi:dTDP-4-amino-4,6-dideoxygalactose transaminase